MAGVNKVILVGNLGADPEIRSTQDGRELATFSLATTDSWKDKNTGERRDKTEWHRVVVFSEGLVKVIKNYVKKGSKLYIEGSLQTRKWQDQQGQERYTTEIVLQGFSSVLVMLDSRGGQSGAPDFGDPAQASYDYNAGGSAPAKSNDSAPVAEELNDEIPF